MQSLTVANQLQYAPDMVHLEDLFAGDLDAAARLASTEVLPDIVAALDQLVPRLTSGDRAVVRRYWDFVDLGARTLTDLPAAAAADLPPSSAVYEILRRDVAELPWVAPSPDGLGIVTVMVDRIRNAAGGMAQECGGLDPSLDVSTFRWFLKVLSEVDRERELSAPLERAMATLALSSTDVAEIMGVRRQAVDKWLLGGPPADRLEKIGALAEVADVLRHRLKDGLPPVVVRRSATAYGDRSMLDLFTADEHEWLRQGVRESFDFSRVA